MVVAVGGEVALDGIAFPLDAAGAQEGLGIRRTQTGECDAFRAVDGLAGLIEQDARGETRTDEKFRRARGGEGAKEVVVLVTDGVAGVAVCDLVGGDVRLLVANFGGINSVVGNEDALESIEDQQPRLGMEPGEEFILQRCSFLFRKVFQRALRHVGERALTEVLHARATLVERIPKATGPGFVLRARGERVLGIGRPLPGEHALAIAADGFEEEEVRGIGRVGPVAEFFEFPRASNEFMRADVVRLGVEGRRLGDGGDLGRGRLKGLGRLFCGVATFVSSECFADLALQVIRGFEEADDSLRGDAFFERFELLLRDIVHLDVCGRDFDGVIHDENEKLLELARRFPLNGSVELQLGNRHLLGIVEVWNPTISPCVDADVDVRFVHHFHRDLEAVPVLRWQVLHPDWKCVVGKAGILCGKTLVGQIARSGANYCS